MEECCLAEFDFSVAIKFNIDIKKYSRFSFCIPPLMQPEAVCLARARRQKG